MPIVRRSRARYFVERTRARGYRKRRGGACPLDRAMYVGIHHATNIIRDRSAYTSKYV